MENRLSELAHLQIVVIAAIVLFALAVTTFVYIAVKYIKKKNTRRPDDSELHMDCAYFIEVGRRPSQQDSLYISPLNDYQKFGITAVVADGMGGMKYGAEISSKIVNHVEDMCPMSFFASEQNADELRRLSNELYDEYKLQGGSTLAMVQIHGNYLNYYSVGDSDIILIRGGVPTILNPRQNYMTILIKSLCRNNKQTQTAYTNSKSRSLIDFMGNQNPHVIYTKKPMRIFDGDVIIISSDGLTDAVSLKNIPNYIKESANGTAAALKAAVASRKRPKQDNYTGIVFSVKRSLL